MRGRAGLRSGVFKPSPGWCADPVESDAVACSGNRDEYLAAEQLESLASAGFVLAPVRALVDAFPVESRDEDRLSSSLLPRWYAPNLRSSWLQS